MKEIKFRAWDNIKKEWLLGYEYESLGGFSLTGECMLMGEWEGILRTMLEGGFGERGEGLKIMQYTGLKDKNGKEIYEGDIVEEVVEFRDGTKSKPQLHKVEWIDDSCGFEPFSDSRENCGHCGGKIDTKECEIIGNIYENSELLK